MEILLKLALTAMTLLLVGVVYANLKLSDKVKALREEAAATLKINASKSLELQKEAYGRSRELSLLKEAHVILYKREKRLTEMVQRLRKRQITITRGITWFKNPETDIRVLKVQAREQLAIDLENDGAIVYVISENYRRDIQGTEITVKAQIKTLKMK